jgi:hypothetical protein
MLTSTGIAVTDRMSDMYGSPFIQIYLFIRTYMSALVDIKQEYKKCHKKLMVQVSLYRPGCRQHQGISKRTQSTLQGIIKVRIN